MFLIPFLELKTDEPGPTVLSINLCVVQILLRNWWVPLKKAEAVAA